jgi:hypothetical protein
MTASRSIAAAAGLALAVCLGTIAAPAHAALKPKPGVTPEQLGECIGTVEVWQSYGRSRDMAVDPVWTRYETELNDIVTHYDPAIYYRAKAAGQTRVDYDMAEIKRLDANDAVGQMISDQLTACAELVWQQ